jgi:hypothetical protein
LGYVGVSSPYGTLTVFRQNTLRVQAIVAYDPMGGSNAFSPIGYQGSNLRRWQHRRLQYASQQSPNRF